MNTKKNIAERKIPASTKKVVASNQSDAGDFKGIADNLINRFIPHLPAEII